MGIKNTFAKNDHLPEDEDLEEQEAIMCEGNNQMISTSIRIKTFIKRSKKILWLILFGVCYGLVFLAFSIGSKEIPLSYFVTIIATTPIFALLFSRYILKTRITLLKMITCLSLIVGICMVMYEGFIKLKFCENLLNDKKVQIENSSSIVSGKDVDALDNSKFQLFNSSTEELDDNLEVKSSMQYKQIYLGIISAFIFATLGALANVIPAKCQEISWCVMMLYAGAGSLLFSIIANIFPSFKLDIWLSNSDSYTSKLAVEITLGFFGMMANGFLILANRLSSPTINSVVRRSEIILVLLYDIIWYKEYPDAIEGCGYAIVLISVIIITFADQVNEMALKLINRSTPMQEV